jgi:hypothetical protein
MRESMKKLLATSAIALVALSGAASAQSVLERVLGQIDNATNLASVNGTFANIAENIGGQTAVNTFGGMATATSGSTGPALATSATQDIYDAWVAGTTVADSAVSVEGDLVYYNPTTGQLIRTADYNNLSTTQKTEFVTVASGDYIVVNADGTYDTATGTAATLAADIAARNTDLVREAGDFTTSYTGSLEGINGSINNAIDGITSVTQQATSGTVTAIEYNMPTFDFGDMATTALGAVNTGDITLGVNSAVDEATTSTTNAISAVVTQLGGSADTGAIVLNVASNMTGVNGSINNVMEEVNGSIGNLSTTALGAVNTGTIVSGVDAAVAGIVGSTSGGSNGQ